MAGKVGMHKRRASGSNSVAYADAVRSRIRAGLITNYLTNHLLGHITLSATQVRAAEILLRKVFDGAACDMRIERVGLCEPHEAVEQVLRGDSAFGADSMEGLLVTDPVDLPAPDRSPTDFPAFAYEQVSRKHAEAVELVV